MYIIRVLDACADAPPPWQYGCQGRWYVPRILRCSPDATMSVWNV